MTEIDLDYNGEFDELPFLLRADRWLDGAKRQWDELDDQEKHAAVVQADMFIEEVLNHHPELAEEDPYVEGKYLTREGVANAD